MKIPLKNIFYNSTNKKNSFCSKCVVQSIFIQKMSYSSEMRPATSITSPIDAPLVANAPEESSIT